MPIRQRSPKRGVAWDEVGDEVCFRLGQLFGWVFIEPFVVAGKLYTFVTRKQPPEPPEPPDDEPAMEWARRRREDPVNPIATTFADLPLKGQDPPPKKPS